MKKNEYLIPKLCNYQKIDLPQGKRIPFGWNAIPVYTGYEPLRLYWDDNTNIENATGSARLRICIALDVREEKAVEVYLPDTRELLGCFDIRYAHVLQVFELCISKEQANDILKQGLELRMVKGASPLWIFFGDPDQSRIDYRILPHIVFECDTNSVESFKNRIASLSSIQLFGWMEGCILDGLVDLYDTFGMQAAKEAAKIHINMYIDEKGNLVYVDPKSEPCNNRIYDIEGILPFAAIAKLFPQNPSLKLFVDFIMAEVDKKGTDVDRVHYTAEGSYTIAYPLAVVSKLTGRDDLAQISIKQLELRAKHLIVGEDLYLRSNLGEKTFKNWARAYAWYMLGLIRTIRELGNKYPIQHLKDEFVRISQITVSKQNNDGLWACYLGEEDTGIETASSAGIAAALAIGAKEGILEKNALECAQKAYIGIKEYFTFDGLLKGASQGNKGGEQLQRSGYRVINQCAMGLMAQLAAALEVDF